MLLPIVDLIRSFLRRNGEELTGMYADEPVLIQQIGYNETDRTDPLHADDAGPFPMNRPQLRWKRSNVDAGPMLDVRMHDLTLPSIERHSKEVLRNGRLSWKSSRGLRRHDAASADA
ncbi:MAG: hypothetical protein WBA25_16865 [Jannaschia sp.]